MKDLKIFVLGVYTPYDAKCRPVVAGRVLALVFGPFLMLRVFWEFFRTMCCFYHHGPNFKQNCLKFCMKLSKIDAKAEQRAV